jgi:hypothetical protein
VSIFRPFILLFVCSLSFAASGELRLKVPLSAQFKSYSDLFSSPEYFLVALQNLNIPLRGVERSEIPKIHSVRVRKERGFTKGSVLVEFKRQKGTLFDYEATAQLSLAGVPLSFTIPVQFDLSDLDRNEGRLILQLGTLGEVGKSFLEAKLNDRVKLFGPELQAQILAYLGSLPKEAIGPALLRDAYNRSAGQGVNLGRMPGDSEPVSDQLVLIFTIVIWSIGIPVLLWFLKRRRSGAGPTSKRRP